MNAELKHALEVIKKHCSKKNFRDEMDKKSLADKIYSLKSEFIMYVDFDTLNYYKGKVKKQKPDIEVGDYREVNLSKKQREDCIQYMKWFIRDIEACISHLEE